MNKRMSLEYKGRPVRLKPIIVLSGALNLHGNTQNVQNARIWETIMEHQWDGKWHSLKPTTMYSVEQLQRTYRQLNKKRWYRGYDSSHLVIKVTELDGICFKWELLDEIDAEVIESALEGIREMRAKTRRKK